MALTLSPVSSTKACDQCGGTLPRTNWKRCSAECRAEYERKRSAARLRSPEYRAYQASYRAQNRARARATTRAWYAANKDRAKLSSRSSSLRRLYGLTLDGFAAMYERQGHACAACGDPLVADNAWVDHCHATGKVRGLLHPGCNTGIGLAGDSAEKLEKWAAYLRKAA